MASLPPESARASLADSNDANEDVIAVPGTDMANEGPETLEILTEEAVSKIPSQTLLERGFPEHSMEPPLDQETSRYNHRVSHLDDEEAEEELNFLMGSVSVGPQPQWLSPEMVQAAEDRLKASSHVSEERHEESRVKSRPASSGSRPPTSAYKYAPAGSEKRDVNLLKMKVTRKGGGGFALKTPSKEAMKIAKCSVLSTNSIAPPVSMNRWIPGKVRVQRTEQEIVQEAMRTGRPISPRLTRDNDGALPISAYIPQPHPRMPHSGNSGRRVKEMHEWLRSITPNAENENDVPKHPVYRHLPGHHVPAAHVEWAKRTKTSQSAAARQKARLGYCPQKGCSQRNRPNEDADEKFADFEAVVSKAEQITMEYEMKLLEMEEEARKAEERMENMISSPRSTRLESPISSRGSPVTPRLLDRGANETPDDTNLPTRSRRDSSKRSEIVVLPQTRPSESPSTLQPTPQGHQTYNLTKSQRMPQQLGEEDRVKGPMEAMIEDDLNEPLPQGEGDENQPPSIAAGEKEGPLGEGSVNSGAAVSKNVAGEKETEVPITNVPERPQINFSSEPLQPWGDSEDNGQMTRRELPRPQQKTEGGRLIPVIRFQDRSGLAKRPARSKPWVHREPLTDVRGSRRPRRKLPFGSRVVRTEENRRRELVPSHVDLGLNRPNTAGAARKSSGWSALARGGKRPESQLSVSGWSRSTSRTAGPSLTARPQSVAGYMRPDSVMTHPVAPTESNLMSETDRPPTSMADVVSERPSSVATVLYDLQVPVLDDDSEDESTSPAPISSPSPAPTHQDSRPNSAGVAPSVKRIPTTAGWQDGARMRPKSPQGPDRHHSRTPPAHAHRRIITITVNDKKRHPAVVFEGEALPPPGTSRPHNADLYPIPSERHYRVHVPQDSGAQTARF